MVELQDTALATKPKEKRLRGSIFLKALPRSAFLLKLKAGTIFYLVRSLFCIYLLKFKEKILQGIF